MNINITDNDLKDLSQTITSLNLSGCNKITDNGLKDLPRLLTNLDLSFCDKITNNGLKYLPQTLTNIDFKYFVGSHDHPRRHNSAPVWPY